MLEVELKYNKAGVVYINNDYGSGLKIIFEQEFNKLGGEILNFETYAQGEINFKSILLKTKNRQPDVILLTVHTQTGGLILKQLAELKIDIPVYGSEGLKDQIVLDIAGKAAEGIKVVVPAQIDNQQYSKFRNNYLGEYNREPENYAVYGYDALKVIAQAIEKAGSTDAGEIKRVLYDTHDYHGASGLINFDEQGEVVGKEYEVWEVKDGEFVKMGE